jgi:hypothetical protein
MLFHKIEKVHAQAHSIHSENRGMPANEREAVEIRHTTLELEKS